MIFGPQNKSEEMLFAIEGTRVDLQHRIQMVLNRCGISRDELARRLGKKRQYVDKKLFAENANPSIVVIAKVFHVMGMELVLTHKPTTHKVRCDIPDCATCKQEDK